MIISNDLRRRIVEHYKNTPRATHVSTADLFSISIGTINRLLRLERETGDIVDKPRKYVPKFKVNLDWLRTDAEKYPDDRLIDRAERYQNECGIKVHISSVCDALHAIGFTHKKKRFMLKNVTQNVSKKRVQNFHSSNLSSIVQS